MTIKELTAAGAQRLTEAGVEEALIDTRLLLSYVLGVDRSYIYTHPDDELPEDKARRFESLIDERAERTPLQHIVGEQEFMGLTFKVNEHVLIPRQDTEILVEEALKELHDGMDILDLCTGSGCVILSLLHYSNSCRGTGVDISSEALLVAGQNARSLGIPLELLEGDVLELGFELKIPEGRLFDMIVSNPPYIPTEDIATLMPEVRDHDPYIALDGGVDGLLFYERIADIARDLLKPGGSLLLETGCDQGESVCAILADRGFGFIERIKDYGGNHRVVKCVRKR